MLAGKAIVLGVTGGIAAYKAAEIVRLLVKDGATVRVVMTRNAQEFITPLTLQTLSGNPVSTETFSLTQESEIGHIRLADTANLLLVAPATANVIAKLAHGLADDLLTTVVLATTAPVLVAPAMNVHMYAHPTVQENLRKLASLGYRLIEPAEGFLACGYEGKGRLADPEDIVEEVRAALTKKDLSAERIIVTAGPNCEPIDPVRFLSNRSTGKMGFAMARVAWRRGAEVTLVSGPTALTAPRGVHFCPVRTAREMQQAGTAAVGKRLLGNQLFREVEIKVGNQHQLNYRAYWEAASERPWRWVGTEIFPIKLKKATCCGRLHSKTFGITALPRSPLANLLDP